MNLEFLNFRFYFFKNSFEYRDNEFYILIKITILLIMFIINVRKSIY